MNNITEGMEQLYLNYIEENKAFLKDFHRIYYNKYKELIKQKYRMFNTKRR